MLEWFKGRIIIYRMTNILHKHE